MKSGLIAFFIVLLLMPLGHTLMVLVEELGAAYRYTGAFAVGSLGLLSLYVGVRLQKALPATVLGLLAGVLVWTGWIEFSYVWIAHKLQVQPLMEGDEVATKPEYLVMLSGLGLLSAFLLHYMFHKTRCQFFAWWQRLLGLRAGKSGAEKPPALTTFTELIMVIWTFYLVLLLVYDKDIAGDDHPLTYLVAFGSLFWSVYLFGKLLRIKKMDYAIRYAIPTVVIFWNFVEVMGRWNLLKEIWLYPYEHFLELCMILSLLLIFSTIYFVEARKTRLKKE
ncbi:hypothetical protein GC194_06720 [bacterium]|nr:hypothetical protein [bacterium]